MTMIARAGAEDRTPLPGSFLRVSVLGAIDIQWPATSVSFPKERLQGRGAAPALGLLKALLTQPDRYALRDWLMEIFWPQSACSKADERLDDVASALRGLLRPPESTAKILHFVYGSRGNGNGYRLEGYPLMWVDADAFEWYVEQAARLDRFGHPSLSFWEQAYQLAARGEFLPEERYADWAQPRRERIEGLYRQCVHRLVHLLRETGAQEEALLRLRRYWQQHHTDEDALRTFVEMLAERERYQEAEQYYAQAREAVQREQRDLSQKTQEVMEYLRLKPLLREPVTRSVPDPVPHALLAEFSQAVTHGIIEAVQVLGRPSPAGLAFGDVSEEQGALGHPPAWGSPSPTDASTVTLCQHISTLLSTSPLTLQELDASTIRLWKERSAASLSTELLYGKTLRHLESVKVLLAYALPSGERCSVCDIMSRTLLLAGVLLYDRGQYPASRHVMHTALQAAAEAHNPTLQAIIWTWMSFTWTYSPCVSLALPCILEANAFAAQRTDSNVIAWIAAVHAEIQARLGHREECLAALQQAAKNLSIPREETGYLFGFTSVLYDGYRGVCLQHFYHPEDPTTHAYLHEAEAALERALASDAPARRKRYYLGDKAKVQARRGEVEAACWYALQCIGNMGQIQSQSIWQRLTDVRSLLDPYSDTSYVKALDAQVSSLRVAQHSLVLQRGGSI